MLSFILLMCIISFNVKKIDTFTTEGTTYAFEILEGANEKAKLQFENNLDLRSIIPKQFQDINKFRDININVYEFPEGISIKPCKYPDKYVNYFKFNNMKILM